MAKTCFPIRSATDGLSVWASGSRADGLLALEISDIFDWILAREFVRQESFPATLGLHNPIGVRRRGASKAGTPCGAPLHFPSARRPEFSEAARQEQAAHLLAKD